MKDALQDFRSRCPGVLGAWIVDDRGKVEELDLTPMIDLDVDRITDLVCEIYLAMAPFRTLPPAHILGGFDREAVLRFDTVIVLARPVAGGLLVLVTEPAAGLARIRALSNLLLRRIERRVTGSETRR